MVLGKVEITKNMPDPPPQRSLRNIFLESTLKTRKVILQSWSPFVLIDHLYLQSKQALIYSFYWHQITGTVSEDEKSWLQKARLCPAEKLNLYDIAKMNFL